MCNKLVREFEDKPRVQVKNQIFWVRSQGFNFTEKNKKIEKKNPLEIKCKIMQEEKPINNFH